MNNRKSIRINSGFTLIEMMVTVAIVTIFASIAVPSFSQMIKNNRIPTTTNEFISSLVLARSEALKRSRNVTVCTSSNQSTCHGSETDFSKGWVILADTDVPTVKELIKAHNGFDNVYIGQGGKEITFLFSGRISGNSTTFQVGHASDDLVKKVVINRVGRIRAEKL